MASIKLMTLVAGIKTLLTGTSVGSGSASSGQVPILNAAGQVDQTMIPGTLAITGGTVDGADVGDTTPAQGSFTTLNATGVTTFSRNSAVSSPTIKVTGTVYAAGTASTSLPHILIQPAGVAAATNWQALGTQIGINADPAFGGYLLDLKTGGTTRFFVANTGFVQCGTIQSTNTGTFSSWMKSAGIVGSIAAKTAAYTLVVTDETIGVSAASAAVTVTLPLAPAVGQKYNLLKTDSSANAVTVSANGGTINGSATYSLTAQWQCITVQCLTGTSGAAVWWIV